MRNIHLIFWKHRRKISGQGPMASSTKKKYLPSPTRPLLNPSSHYIHCSRINLWRMLGKKIRWEGGQGEKKRDCLLSYRLNKEYSISRRKQLFILINVLTTPTQSIFFLNCLHQIWNLKEKKKAKTLQTRHKIRTPGLLGKIHNKNCNCLSFNLQNNNLISKLFFIMLSTTGKKNNNPYDI